MLAVTSACTTSPESSTTSSLKHPTEPTMEVELSLSGLTLEENAAPPPAQILVIPKSYIDIQGSGLDPSPDHRLGPTPLIILAVPYHGESSSATEQMQMSLGISTEGFETRIRRMLGPAVDADPEISAPPPGFQLVKWLGPVASQVDRLNRSDYVAEDTEFGFVWISCLPNLEPGGNSVMLRTRRCMVVSSLTRDLIAHVGMNESVLKEWRTRLVAARDIVKGFVKREH